MEIEYEGEIDEEDKMMVEDYIMDSFHNALNEEVAI
jgi:hypothetical protein